MAMISGIKLKWVRTCRKPIDNILPLGATLCIVCGEVGFGDLSIDIFLELQNKKYS